MNVLLLLLGYAPLVAALVILMVRWWRKKRQNSRPEPELPEKKEKTEKPPVKEYPYQAFAIPNADRILQDDGPSLKDADMEDLKDRLCNVLEREKLYLNPDLRVGDVSERLYTNKSYLAQTIKLKLNKNFCQLLHYYSSLIL